MLFFNYGKTSELMNEIKQSVQRQKARSRELRNHTLNYVYKDKNPYNNYV